MYASCGHPGPAKTWSSNGTALPPPLGLTLYVPNVALTEVRAVRPDAAPLLADVLTYPSVIFGELDAATAGQVDQLLLDADVFDGCALRAHRPHPRLAGIDRRPRQASPRRPPSPGRVAQSNSTWTRPTSVRFIELWATASLLEGSASLPASFL